MNESPIPGITRRPLGLFSIVLCCLAQGVTTQAQTVRETELDPSEPVVKLDDVDAVASDDSLLMPTQPTRSVFGLNMSLAETPRSATIVNSVMLDNLGIRNTEDLIKVSPATYSNFRFGLQGNVSIRNQTSDFYFRGMRRIDPQGNFRTMWTANDSLEIVRGPASPIFGLGRIGGYVNFNPKTGRLSKTGKYLEANTGQFRFTYGSYNKKIATGEVGGPVDIPLINKKGGFHLYAYLENSDHYKVNTFEQQELVQGTLIFDLTDELRLETGFVVQHSKGGLPGGINRTTRDMIERGTYWDGGFSYQLDENRDGYISERETRNAYFAGLPQLSAQTNNPWRTTSLIGPSLYFNGSVNDTFLRIVPWQGSTHVGLARTINPATITMDQFMTGYTQTYDARTTRYLATGIDPGPGYVGPTSTQQRQGYQLWVYPTKTVITPEGVRDQVPDTTQAPQPFFMPVPWDLDAASFREVPLNKRMSHGEDYYEANIGAFFFDVINDVNVDYSLKNQTFLDGHRQIKDGRNPFSQRQAPFTAENKTTFGKKFTPFEWLVFDTITTANVHHTSTYRVSTSPTDYDMRRSLVHNDASMVQDTFTPNDTFFSMIQRRGYEGSPPSFTAKSRYTISGVGSLIDISIFKKLNLLLGGRWDYIDAHTLEPAGTYQKGSNTNPGGPYSTFAGTGLFTDRDFKAHANDDDYSWSSSLSYQLFPGVRPYVTYAEQALIINNASAGELSVRPLLTDQLLGKSRMYEFGLKTSLLKDKLVANVATYEQTRVSFDAVSTVGGGASSTLSRGWEGDVRWTLNRQFTVIAGASFSQAKYLQGGGVFGLDARTVGYPDVVDATGKVVIPAEAFGWGGRLGTTIPDSEPDFREVEGIPDRVLNFTVMYTPTPKWILQTTVYHQGTFATDRFHTINVDAATTLDGLIGYRAKTWEVNLNVTNVFDTEIWNKGSLIWLDPKFPRSVDISYTYKF
jgi:iron complex outermembrane receptor protein